MPTLKLTDKQVTELIQQLPPEGRRELLLALAKDAAVRRDARMQKGESQLRQLASQRGMNWDTMSEQQREELIDNLVHEDRGCR